MSERTYRVAMMFAGDPSSRATLKLDETRLGDIAKALRNVGLDVEAAVYADEVADEVREQLLRVDGVLVWVDPVRKDGNRAKLDPLLCDVASHGVFVSSHPDLILKMGTKEVLYRTRNMSWGTDTRLYTTVEQFRRELPQCLAEGKPRVLKQYRGNGGIGVWKVEAVDPGVPRKRVRVRHALCAVFPGRWQNYRPTLPGAADRWHCPLLPGARPRGGSKRLPSIATLSPGLS